jgi:hypothetical protein
MKRSKLLRSATAALVLGAAWQFPADAQFIYTLPDNDFTWNWGDPENRRGGHADIDVSGNDQRFRCTLTARLSPASSISMSGAREIENELRGALEFVRVAVNIVETLDARRDLDWATLACVEPKSAPVSEEQKLEREARAREKMQREVERRRARQQRDDDD